MRASLIALALAVLLTSVAVADKPGKGVPPGQAKKGGVPPGLAKKFGAKVPERAYIALDPRHQDRAYFLVEGRWVLQSGFEQSVRVEVQQAISLPAVPPPVPLPPVSAKLHVVLFQ